MFEQQIELLINRLLVNYEGLNSDITNKKQLIAEDIIKYLNDRYFDE